MTAEQYEHLQELLRLQQQLSDSWNHYWLQFSHFGTWQFWLNVGMLLIPLVVLYFLIDRKNAFHLGFFGFNVHVWFTYIDAVGLRHSLWQYPYQAVPFMPVSFALDASFIPVVFMLVYQWTLKHEKNPYVYLMGLNVFLSFMLKPIMVYLNLFAMYKWVNFFHLFLGYTIILLLSKWITNIFLGFSKQSTERV